MSILVVRALVAGAAFHGIEARTLAEAAGIPMSVFGDLSDPDARVPARVLLAFWEVLRRLTRRDDFGLRLAELSSAAPLTAAAWFSRKIFPRSMPLPANCR